MTHHAVYFKERNEDGEVVSAFAVRHGLQFAASLLGKLDDDGRYAFSEVVATLADGSGTVLFKRGNDWPEEGF